MQLTDPRVQAFAFFRGSHMLNLLQVGVAVGLEKQLQRSDLQMRVTGVLISNGEDAIVARGADSAAANIRVKPRGGNDVE